MQVNKSFLYTVTCDETPEITEFDTITYYRKGNLWPREIAQNLAETFMTEHLYDWDGETEPGDLFHIVTTVTGLGQYTVRFFSNSPFNYRHSPDHEIVVNFS